MMIYLFTFIFMFFSSMVVFVSKRKHMLLMLLSLEFGVVSLYFGMILLLSQSSSEIFFSMIFLTMSVCESALSLSLLVLMIRTHGNDFILTFNSLW